MLEFKLLGPLEVGEDGRPITLGGPKQRATLAILLLEANRVVPIERMADDLYAGRPPVTAVTQVQRQVSELRRGLGGSSGIETQPPGYRIRVEPDQVDLARFERLHADAVLRLQDGDARVASSLLTQALGLFRGSPLADLADETFAQVAAERIEEMRLAALETRIDADLVCGRHRELTPELDQLVAEHPYRESLHAQRMLALYRSGRQVEALDGFREARRILVQGLGLEPGTALRRLERAILEQDPALELASQTRQSRPVSAVLALPASDATIEALGQVVQPLVNGEGAELLLVRLLTDGSTVASAADALARARSALGVPVRTAAFTTTSHIDDIIRLVTTHDVELIVLDTPRDSDLEVLPGSLVALLDRSPVDVAVIVGEHAGAGEGIFVPFGGGEHDWAALEWGASIASTTGQRLVLVGTEADPRRDRRDASRLLADASLAVQRVVGIEASPMLAEQSLDSLLDAVETGFLVVMGLPSRSQARGIDRGRRFLARRARPPTLLIHRGPRPGMLAPTESRTRFTWSLGGSP